MFRGQRIQVLRHLTLPPFLTNLPSLRPLYAYTTNEVITQEYDRQHEPAYDNGQTCRAATCRMTSVAKPPKARCRFC
jgi:hypothetical protein